MNPDGDSSRLQNAVQRNLSTARKMREQAEQKKTRQERLADTITGFVGSIKFAYWCFAVVVMWLVVNLGLVASIRPFDPYPFVLMAMIASVLAIFLSTFILISQNRMAAESDKRNELNLQITLLTEHEVTRLMALVDSVAKKMGVASEAPKDTEELKKDVPHEKLIEEIEKFSA